jgi:endonuclease YncB( thermonuclease family)
MDGRARLRAALGALIVSAWVLAAALRGGWLRAPPGPVEVRARDVVVLDGDTLLVDGRVVRLVGADTPEQAAPWFEGSQEPWASRASARTRAALDAARRIVVVEVGVDGRDRLLAHVVVDDRPLAALLIEAGLALETVSRFGDGGRPDLAAAILAAARQAPAVAFEPPWTWRKRHRRPEAGQ